MSSWKSFDYEEYNLNDWLHDFNRYVISTVVTLSEIVMELATFYVCSNILEKFLWSFLHAFMVKYTYLKRMLCKQIYLTYPQNTNRYYISESEWIWEVVSVMKRYSSQLKYPGTVDIFCITQISRTRTSALDLV